MSDLQAIADHVEIEALRGEFTDAVMMRDYDHFASLSHDDKPAAQRDQRCGQAETARARAGQPSCRPKTAFRRPCRPGA